MLTEHDRRQLAELKALHEMLGEQLRESLAEVERIKQAFPQVARPAAEKPPASERDGREPPLAFVHIPKTAGGTVTAMVAAAFSKRGVLNVGNWLNDADNAVAKVDAVNKKRGARMAVGHVPYGVFRDGLSSDARYVTFLREPIDRVISHYYRHIHVPEDRAARSRRRFGPAVGKGAKAASLDEALARMHLPELNNLSTRFLCSHPTTGELPPEALEEAKANLQEFAFVGVQDRFWESIVLFKRLIGLELMPTEENRHVNFNRPALDEVSDEDRELIAYHNSFDVELYGFATALFEDAVSAVGESVAQEAEQLAATSAAINEESRATLQQVQEWLAEQLAAGKSVAALVEEAESAGIPDRAFRHATKTAGVKHDLREASQQIREASKASEKGAQPLLGFVHVPKTAGGTVTAMLADIYAKRNVLNMGNWLTGADEAIAKLQAASGRPDARVAVGHVPFGVFRGHIPPDSRYMTFVREPVDRVVSHYYRHIHRPLGQTNSGGRVKRALAREDKIKRVKAESLEEALVDLRLRDICNLLTRFLCNDPTVDELQANALDEAKANLRDFAFVGIQEQFWESVVVLQHVLDEQLAPSGEDRHVNPARPSVHDLSDQDRALIIEYNSLDLELYSFAQELFEEARAAAPEAVEQEADRLRGLAASVNERARAAHEHAHSWLERELPLGSTRSGDELRESAAAEGISEMSLKRAAKELGVTKEEKGNVWARGLEPLRKVRRTP